MPIAIRPETPADEAAIEQLTRAAFRSHPYSQQTEQFIIRALRAAHALSLSLVATVDDRVVGHVAFSPVTIADGCLDWYGLGPVAVEPASQGKGIGRALIEHGLAALRERGAKGCVLVGEPAFYARFGFAHMPALLLDGVPAEFFLALPLGSSAPRGKVSFHAAFTARS
jgi:putative acetyltransferase